MSQALPLKKIDLTPIVRNLVTEDDEPVGIFLDKQQRLLTEALYSSWALQLDEEHSAGKRSFLASANVGIFFSVRQPPLIPDMLLSLDIALNNTWKANELRSYFVWELGKVPEVVVEITSNKKGQELTSRLKRYAEWGIIYYIAFDPGSDSATLLRVYEMAPGKQYRLRKDFLLPTLGLRLTLWEGEYEGLHDTWLRWCDQHGRMLPTGREARDLEAARADTAAAEVARLRAELAALSSRPRRKK